MPNQTIVTTNVDVDLLREQRDALLAYNESDGPQPSVEIIEGLVNLLDHMLDVAEGHAA